MTLLSRACAPHLALLSPRPFPVRHRACVNARARSHHGTHCRAAAISRDSIGSLEIGKRADVIQVAFDDVHHVPTYNVISHLVYVSDEQDVASVVVDGQVLMLEGEMLTIDTSRVRAEATEIAARIQRALEQRNGE